MMSGVIRPSVGILWIVGLLAAACGPLNPEPESVTGGSTGETKVTVTRTDPTEASAPGPPAPKLSPSQMVAAKALDPKPAPIVSPATPLISGQSGDGALPLPTVLATTKSALFVFGRTRAGWVVRTQLTKAKPGWSPPVVVVSAFDDDAQPFAIGDGDAAWFGVTSKIGGTRVARVDVNKVTALGKIPTKLGTIASLVPLKGHVVAIGRDGDAITFARIDRTSGFLDATAKVIARGTATSHTTASRSPRATSEDDKVLVAWDADEVTGALETPGTTPAERAAPKSGIFVRRFTSSGEPASPARRLTRPSFEAHALDVVVELGACAVLASTAEGFEMFRFVRKGDDLGPYGGGLHLAGPGGDVSLGADVIGTIGVTSTKLLRIGPGIKIVPSPLGFAPPPGGAFDEVRIAMDGYGAHVAFATRTPLGPQPTLARIDGEHMGGTLPTPWTGPPPQRLVFAALDGDEALSLVIDGGTLHAVRLSDAGASRGTAIVPYDAKQASALDWPNAPVPRAMRAGGEWIVTLRDGQVLLATGPRAGSVIGGPPKGAPPNGALAVVPNTNKSAIARVVYVPPAERAMSLWTATIDPKKGVISAWTSVAGSEHHYGALGGARYAALPRTGGLVLLTNSGPKVSTVAQLYGLVAIDSDGIASDVALEPPAPLQEVSLVPSLGGATLVATVSGKGVAARWLDGPTGWREDFSFMPFRVRGDGPVVRDKNVAFVLPEAALPVDPGPEAAVFLGDRCPFVLPAGKRALLLVCEEGSGEAPLAARVTGRLLRL